MKIKNKNIECKRTNKNSRLEYMLEKPNVDGAKYRLQEFHCSNQEICNYYKEKQCPYSNCWKDDFSL